MIASVRAVRRMSRVPLPAGLRRLAGSLWVTLCGQGLLLLGLLLITRVSAAQFGAVGFGEYQVARRTLAVVAFPLMCGVGVSLPRFVASSIGDPKGVGEWLVSGGVLSAILMMLSLGLAAWWSSEIGQWTFGGRSGIRMVHALLVAVAGQFCHTLAYGAMRGLSRFRSAATLQVVNGAFVPMAAVLLAGGRVERALVIGGGLGFAIGLVAFIDICRRYARPLPSVTAIYGATWKLFLFGAPRIPGEVALFGLFALPSYAAVHRNDIVGAGFISVGLSLVQAVATVFASAGLVLLPYWSRAAKSVESRVVAERRIAGLVLAAGIATTAVLVVLQVFLPSIVHLLLGPLANGRLGDIRYVLLAVLPFVIYLILRDYFDAVSVFPMNTIALSTAIVIQAALMNGQWFSVPVATTSSFLVLGFSMAGLWAAYHSRAGYRSGGRNIFLDAASERHKFPGCP
jgi:O-antigen/teichoic acid export membrane protein